MLPRRTRLVTGRLLQRRWMTPAPRPGEGPLMTRRADRELPDISSVSPRWRTLPAFLAVVAVCSVAIFNYQKSSSPIISATLYALRTSPSAREALGDEIYFKQRIPWVSGEMNQVRGRVDVSFSVKGTRGSGVMRFASHRPSPKSLFRTTAWTLTMGDATIDLLDGGDPFRGLLDHEEDVDEGVTRGFRQQGAYHR